MEVQVQGPSTDNVRIAVLHVFYDGGVDKVHQDERTEVEGAQGSKGQQYLRCRYRRNSRKDKREERVERYE
jgi:hypothetical protein